MISKKEVLENLDEVKKYIEEAENKKEEKVVGIQIKNRWTGDIIFQSSKTTWKDAVEEAKTHADLTDANLTHADLTHANLTHADLTDADLTSANLTGANLTDANLTDADLTSADLTSADLTACKFYMGSSNRNFEALCKAIKTIKWNSKRGEDFIK